VCSKFSQRFWRKRKLQNYPVELLQEMLRTYSPSGSETELAHLLLNHMRFNGFKARIDQVGNVIGEIGDTGPKLLLCGHMDTIPGQITVRRDGDLLFGRGAVDAKSSLAAMLVGASLASQKSVMPFKVTLAAVVEEETTSKGIRAIIEDSVSYDLGVFGEPSGASNLVIGYKGSLKMRLTCKTLGGHSASPWLSSSSYDESYKFWKTFADSLLQNDSQSKFSAVTGCVTGAHVGDSGNCVPTHATLDMDIRIPPGVSSNDLAEAFQQFTAQYETDHPNLNLKLEVWDRTEAFLGDGNSSGISAFRWAIRKKHPGRVAFVKKTGTSDMNLFAEKYRIPMFAYGPGDSSLDHTDNEHVSITEYLNSIGVYAFALPRFAELTLNSVLLPTTTQ
jgi:LysW-gamma-L-lysine carboxypeptidase